MRKAKKLCSRTVYVWTSWRRMRPYIRRYPEGDIHFGGFGLGAIIFCRDDRCSMSRELIEHVFESGGALQDGR